MLRARTISGGCGLAVVLSAIGLCRAQTPAPSPAAETNRASTPYIVDEVPLVYTAQILPGAETGNNPVQGDATAQSRQVLQTLDRILKNAGSELGRVVKLNVYLAERGAAPGFRTAFDESFKGSTQPPVSIVVSGLPRPGALVAVDAVAIAVADRISSSKIPESNGIAGARTLPAGPKLYVSGMADTNKLPVATRKTLEKLSAVVKQLGSQNSDIVQLKAFLQPMAEVSVVEKELVAYFEGHAPPCVFVEWISPAPNPPIEIELIAVAHGDEGAATDSVTFLTPPGTTSSKVFSRVARVNRGRLIYFPGIYGEAAQDSTAQVRQIFNSLGALLPLHGTDFDHLVKATYYFSDDEAGTKLNDVRPEFLNPLRPPAASKAKVRDAGAPGRTVMVDMIAVTK